MCTEIVLPFSKSEDKTGQVPDCAVIDHVEASVNKYHRVYSCENGKKEKRTVPGDL